MTTPCHAHKLKKEDIIVRNVNWLYRYERESQVMIRVVILLKLK